MISTNALSIFILHHHRNGISNKNLFSIQEIMRASDPASKKYKKVCKDFPNLAILTKSATPGKVQLTFGHANVGEMSLGESVVAFALAGYLSSPSVVSPRLTSLFPRTETRSVSRSRKFSFAPPPAALRARRISSTGRRATPPSSRHFSRRQQFSTGSQTRSIS